ncbi:uncharacterized protein QYS62_000830 [Fusarium acuminatum]|uniref:Uncharacterized protein n=1 Tax=Fusarium acuminatum TaxID=5515 RepID=A0ABZ2WGU8_9HYPO
MCKYIHFRYEQCNHQIFDRCEPCWKDYWEAFCPFFPVPTSLCPNGHEHRQSEIFVVKPGKCRTCTKQEKEASRRDYGGFTAQATRGFGSSEEASQDQVPEAPANTRRSRGYRAQSQTNMAPQERGTLQSHGYQAHSRMNMAPQEQQRNPYFERPRLERRNAVRIRQVGNKVIMDRLPRPPPNSEPYYQVNPSLEGHVPVQDEIDRSWTVSPLTENDMRAPYVEISLEDEYSAPF